MRFNPHPARRPGAAHPRSSAKARAAVSTLTRPEGRVLRSRARLHHLHPHVSTLTRPEGRVLRVVAHPFQLLGGVSTLTRPEGRVLLPLMAADAPPSAFQPSPGPKAGCCSCHDQRIVGVPAVSTLTRPEGRVLRARRRRGPGDRHVSTLTRPEGRVLPLPASRHALDGRVSTLTRPEGRVLHHRGRRSARGAAVSTLTRPEGRVLLRLTWALAVSALPRGQARRRFYSPWPRFAEQAPRLLRGIFITEGSRSENKRASGG